MITELFPGIHTYIIDAFVAAQRSKAIRKKMGSILVGRLEGNVWQIISDGCNGVNSGDEHIFEHEGVTLPTVRHAEYNAIQKAVGSHFDIDIDLSFYKEIVLIVLSSPCVHCANHIVKNIPANAVIYVESYRDQTGVGILEDKGIKCYHVTVDLMSSLIKHTESVLFELTVAKCFGLEFKASLNEFIRVIANTYTDGTPLIKSNVKNELYGQFGFARIQCAAVGDIDKTRMLRYSLLSIGRQYQTAEVFDNPGPPSNDLIFKLPILDATHIKIAELSIGLRDGSPFMNLE